MEQAKSTSTDDAGAGGLAGDDMDEAIREHGPRVRSIAWRIAATCPPDIDPEELIAAGLRGVVAALESYRPGRGTLGAWVGRRVRWAILDHLRVEGKTRGRAGPLPGSHVDEDGHRFTDGEAIPDHRQGDPARAVEARELVAAILRGLDPDDRALARLRLAGGCSPRAAAALLGVATTTIHNREKRLLATLRDRAMRLGA
ncbi:MAG: sigma-70 family RNA polymerase sigma factor [Planctomycetota bacterium]|nr:sigma-70 family RNA polymerase sigma factor [Planctomycetota bacterium]